MNEKRLSLMLAGLELWKENFGQGMEYRGSDGMSWYDLSINANSLPCEADTAIIVTAWRGHLRWLKSTLTSYRLSGAFVILSYDSPFLPWVPLREVEILNFMPNAQHYLLANASVMKHITYDSNKRNGTFWNTRYAQGVINLFPNIKYVYATNGDCIWEKPDGLRDLIELLGEGDLMSGQSTENLIHTADVLYKVEAFKKIYDYISELMKIPVIGSRNPEVNLREAVAELKLKVIHAPKQPIYPQDGSVDMYCCYNQDSTFKELVGFRNLFAEYETAGEEGLEMMFLKSYVDNYMDWTYWGGEERISICKYWETGDRRYLYHFWSIWEDSWYNRLYCLLDFYGKESIYDKDINPQSVK